MHTLEFLSLLPFLSLFTSSYAYYDDTNSDLDLDLYARSDLSSWEPSFPLTARHAEPDAYESSESPSLRSDLYRRFASALYDPDPDLLDLYARSDPELDLDLFALSARDEGPQPVPPHRHRHRHRHRQHLSPPLEARALNRRTIFRQAAQGVKKAAKDLAPDALEKGKDIYDQSQGERPGPSVLRPGFQAGQLTAEEEEKKKLEGGVAQKVEPLKKIEEPKIGEAGSSLLSQKGREAYMAQMKEKLAKEKEKKEKEKTG